MKVTVSVGPGPYSGDMIRQLLARHALHRVIYSWPRFEVWQVNRNGELEPQAGFRNYDRLVWLTWALWRRIPRWGRYRLPDAFLYSLFDRLASKFSCDCDIFLGWSQVSLCSLYRAKHLGVNSVLEHPMVHVSTWMVLMKQEYAVYGRGARSYPMLFSVPMVKRMQQEYAVADSIDVLSTTTKRTFLEHEIDDSKVYTVSPGVDPNHFAPRSEANFANFRVLYVGRIELLKGVHYLLKAFHELALPDAELWLVGAVAPEMEPFLTEYAGHYHYLGQKSREELPAIYQQSSVLVLPSLHDGFGLVLLEAMACGIPVIATDLTGGPDVIRAGENGFVVSSRDIVSLKDRLLWLYEHQKIGIEMGMAARQTVVDNFTWDGYGQRLTNHLNSLLQVA